MLWTNNAGKMWSLHHSVYDPVSCYHIGFILMCHKTFSHCLNVTFIYCFWSLQFYLLSIFIACCYSWCFCLFSVLLHLSSLNVFILVDFYSPGLRELTNWLTKWPCLQILSSTYIPVQESEICTLLIRKFSKRVLVRPLHFLITTSILQYINTWLSIYCLY